MKLRNLLVSGALLLAGSASAALVDGVRQKPEISMDKAIEAKTDGTRMYMYNVSAKKFFLGANDWDTRASVGDKGFKMWFEQELVDGAWDGKTVQWKDSVETRSGNLLNVFMLADGVLYVDNAGENNRLYELQAQGNNVYRIQVGANLNGLNNTYNSTNNPGNFIGSKNVLPEGASEDTRLYWNLTAETEGAQLDWIFITVDAYKAHQDALVLYSAAQNLKSFLDNAKANGIDVSAQVAVYENEASTEEEIDAAVEAVKEALAKYEELNTDPSNPVDKTAAIANPDYSSGKTDWTDTNSDWAVSYNVAEHYDDTFDHYQIVKGIPAGVYAVTLRGYNRPQSSGTAYQYYVDGTPHYLFLYAATADNEVSMNMPNIWAGASEAALGVGSTSTTKDANGKEWVVTNNMQGAEAYFNHEEHGPKYDATLFFATDCDSIRLGIKQEEKNGGDWSLWDNWRLTYYGSKAEAYQVWADNVVANAPKFANASVATKGMVDEYNNTLAGLKASSKEEVLAVIATVDAAAEALRENVNAWARYNALIAEANGLGADPDINQDSDYAIELVAYVMIEAEEIASAKELATAELLAEVEKLAKLVDDCKKKALLDNADVTAKFLVNADYSNGTTGWLGTWTAVASGCMEAYAREWDAYQIAEGAPQGVYEVSLQGFYRVKRGNDAYTLYQNGQQICPGDVYINNNTNPVKCVFDEPVLKSESIYSGVNDNPESGASAFENAIVYGEPYAHIQMGDSVLFPNTMATAGEAFAAGMFKSTANGVVAKDGQELRLGVKGKYQADTWVIWDNFKMVFRGKQVKYVLPHLEEAIVHAGENLEKNMDKTTKESLAAAKAAAEGVLTSTDEDVVFQALVDLYNLNDSVNASVELYATLLESAEALFEDIAMSPASEAVKNEAATFIETVQIGVDEGTIGKAEAESLLTQTKLWSIKLRMPDVTGASDANAIDVTNVLLNPDFGDNAGVNTTEGWDNATGSTGSNDTQKGALAYEYWQTTFDMSQTIIGGLPNGTYRVEVTAFSRIGSGDEDYAAFVNAPDTLPASRALLYAWSTTDSLNTYREAPVQLWGAGACAENLSDGSATVVAAPGDTLFVPGSMVSASAWFDATEAYKNSLYVEVTDGTLCIGMKKTEAPTSSWVVMDSWKLFYLGTESNLSIEGVGVEPNGSVVSVEVFNANGVQLNGVQQGVNIIRTTYSNGATTVKKFVK